MRLRSVLVAAALVVTGMMAARAVLKPGATGPAAPGSSEAAREAVSDRPSVASRAPEATPPSVMPPSAESVALQPTTAATTEAEPADAAAFIDARASNDQRLVELGSSDPFVVLDAANHLAARKETRAIPALVKLDIRKSAQSAPSVIDALGRLGAVADPDARKVATDRLLALLTQERASTSPESPGNVLGIYAALGNTLDPRAAPTLEAELLDPKVTLAAKTVVVDALVRLRQPSSAAALRTLQQQLPNVTTSDALEEEVRTELAAAVAAALRSLP